MAIWGTVPPPITMCAVPRGHNVTPEPRPVPEPPDAGHLLSLVAEALTQCEQAGIAVKLKHGAVMTRVGYVLPLGDGEWCARTLNWSPFSAQAGDDEDLRHPTCRCILYASLRYSGDPAN